MIRRAALALALAFGLAGAAQAVVPGAMRLPDRSPRYGLASYYCCSFHGRRAADGSTFDENGMTAAHRTLPFGTRVRVTNLHNGRRAVLIITDRGPFIDQRHRIIDVSLGAARKLGGVGAGIFPVEVVPLP